MFKTTQDLNFNYSKKIDASPNNFITGHHIDVKYLRSFFAECYVHIPLKDKTSPPCTEVSVLGLLIHHYTRSYVCRDHRL